MADGKAIAVALIGTAGVVVAALIAHSHGPSTSAGPLQSSATAPTVPATASPSPPEDHAAAPPAAPAYKSISVCAADPGNHQGIAVSTDGTENNIFNWAIAPECAKFLLKSDINFIYVAYFASVGSIPDDTGRSILSYYWEQQWNDYRTAPHYSVNLPVCVDGEGQGKSNEGYTPMFDSLKPYNVVDGRTLSPCDGHTVQVKYFQIAIGGQSDLIRVH